MAKGRKLKTDKDLTCTVMDLQATSSLLFLNYKTSMQALSVSVHATDVLSALALLYFFVLHLTYQVLFYTLYSCICLQLCFAI